MSHRHTRFAAQFVAFAWLAPLAAADAVIRPESSQVEARPGDTVRMLWLIEDISIPLFGYSLALRPIDNGGLPQLGSVSIDVNASNFFEPRNVIIAGGKDLHPTFTLITGQADGGAFFSTNTADFSTVLVQPGVNDVLAEVVFTVGSDALGTFVFDLGPASALSDALGFPIAFQSLGLTMVVIPSPSTIALLLAGGVCLRWGR